MPPRAALLPLASTLHRDVAAGALEQPILGLSLIDQQLRLLRETGHDSVVLLALSGEAIPPCDNAGVRLVRTAAAAAAALEEAQAVTLLGHGVLMAPSLLSHGAREPESLLVRPSCSGWERIDAERGWGGALVLPAAIVRAALADLGDWDAQATLLRVAVQRDVRQHRVSADEVAHGFDGGGATVLMAADAERRVARDDGLVTRPVQRLLRPLAMRLAHRSTVPLAEMALAVCAGASVVAASLAHPITAFALGLFAAVMLSLTLAERRLRRMGEEEVRALSLLALASLPVVSAWTVQGGVALLLGVALCALVSVQSGRKGLPAWARLDLVLMALMVGTAGLGLMPALALGLALLALAPASRPVVRRRVRNLVRGTQD